MSKLLKKNKKTLTNKNNNIINDTNKKLELPSDINRKIVKKNNKIKITENNFCIPKFKEYENMHIFNYKKSFLKDICIFYKLKKSGNKDELNARIYIFLYHSYNIIKIQKIWKRFILIKYNKLRGPAIFNRNKCVNETDFYTLENLKDIPYKQFYSFIDVKNNNQIYGFDILSIHNLLFKFNIKSTNPYNRQSFPNHVIEDIKLIKKFSNFFNDKITYVIEEPEIIPKDKQLEFKTIALFHEMDELGNYTDASWFNSLNTPGLVRFLRELIDIWMYRAQLTITIKREICPPNGDPFRFLNINYINNYNFETLKEKILNIIEIFVKRGVNNESKILGTNYVLCALTLVNNDAAMSLPWLYQSVAPH